MAKAKIHPLWYTEFIPILFFVSSIFAGLSMIIVEGTISHRVLKDHMDAEHGDFDRLIYGLARGAATPQRPNILFVMFDQMAALSLPLRI
mgnify:CR=1 FL=1